MYTRECPPVVTFGSRWLQVVSSQGAPADGEDVPRVVAAVVVEGSSPAVKGDQHLGPAQSAHCCRTDEMRIFPVHCFQLHTDLKGVLFWGRGLLLGDRVEEEGQLCEYLSSVIPNINSSIRPRAERQQDGQPRISRKQL